MEYPKILCAAIFVVMLSSAALSAPLMSTTRLHIRLSLAPSLANATTEMKNVYPFIASNTILKNPMIALGAVYTQTWTKNMQLKDKLSVAYIKLSNFISPLYMAYSYEEIQGPQHNVLTQLLMATSFCLNNTASFLRYEILKNGFSVPGGQNLTEAQLDHYTRRYLQALVDNKLVTLAITDDVVKVYRNYTILFTLHDVIKYMRVTGI